MNKKYIITFVAILVIFVIGVLYFLYNQQVQPISTINTTYPQSSSFNFYPINKIKSNEFNSGTFNTEGYVVKIYTCPSCPAGAQCEPCMRDNIVISENNKLLESYSLSDKEMILFVDNPKQFELGEKYTFSIKILDHKSTSEPINDVEIVGYNSGTTLNGTLIKNGWNKSFESYCAQGSDYFTLKTESENLVLEFEPVYSEEQMTKFSDKNVAITGEMKSRKIECPEGSQCPATPDGVFTCEVFKVNKISDSKSINNSVNCVDCGESGWQKMSNKCGQSIITKNDFKSCLINFSWSSVNQNTSTDEIKDGYIEIGGSEVLKNPTTKSIKVFIYHQWAVDRDGNLYLLGQLG
jgi:hypothetical protein